MKGWRRGRSGSEPWRVPEQLVLLTRRSDSSSFSVLLESLREKEWKVLISLFWIFYRQRKGSVLKDLELCECCVWEPVSSPLHSCSFYNILFLKINTFQVLMSALSSSFSAAWRVGTFCTKTFCVSAKKGTKFWNVCKGKCNIMTYISKWPLFVVPPGSQTGSVQYPGIARNI